MALSKVEELGINEYILLWENGLIKSNAKSNLYIMHNKGDITIFILYVDNQLITCNDTKKNMIEIFFRDEFDMVDWGKV
jgi:hypothetical protein